MQQLRSKTVRQRIRLERPAAPASGHRPAHSERSPPLPLPTLDLPHPDVIGRIHGPTSREALAAGPGEAPPMPTGSIPSEVSTPLRRLPRQGSIVRPLPYANRTANTSADDAADHSLANPKPRAPPDPRIPHATHTRPASHQKSTNAQFKTHTA